MSTLLLELPLPPSANRYWVPARGRGLVPSHEALRYRAQVRAAVGRNVRPLAGNCRILIEVFRARAAGDLDNVLKALFDALNGVAWLDDSQVVRLEACAHPASADPHVELEIVGERFATAAEAAAHAQKKAETNRKRRATLAKNRVKRALRGRLAQSGFRVGDR